MSPRLVVFGLGNPGPRYEGTRHNLGFRVVDRLAFSQGGGRWRGERSYDTLGLDVEGTRVDLVRPRTYMNLSGTAVGDWAGERGIDPAEMLVVVDDTAIPLGRLRLRRWGSDGGHNGLKSVIAALGTAGFARLRLGVGPVPAGVDPAAFVLSSFAPEEKDAVSAMVERAVLCVEAIVRQGIERAMGEFNAPDAANAEGSGLPGKRVDRSRDV